MCFFLCGRACVCVCYGQYADLGSRYAYCILPIVHRQYAYCPGSLHTAQFSAHGQYENLGNMLLYASTYRVRHKDLPIRKVKASHDLIFLARGTKF